MPRIFFATCSTRIVFVFFLSSRRRHTRCYRDWSSDVCSSDLAGRVERDFLGVRLGERGPFGGELGLRGFVGGRFRQSGGFLGGFLGTFKRLGDFFDLGEEIVERLLGLVFRSLRFLECLLLFE